MRTMEEIRIYKYLPSQYVESLVHEGKFLFRTLNYFQDFEDNEVRGDMFEGVHKYSKADGLEIKNVTTGEELKENWTFKSKVKSEDIYIFSTSTVLSESLAKEFQADACVEFTNFGRVLSKLRMAVRLRKKIKPNKLFSLGVEYYSESEAPGINWALPEKIASRKLNQFSRQHEHRLMFSHKNALNFGNTSQELDLFPQSGDALKREHNEIVLKLGNIAKWCKIHEFA